MYVTAIVKQANVHLLRAFLQNQAVYEFVFVPKDNVKDIEMK